MKIPHRLQRDMYDNLKFLVVKQAYAIIAEHGSGESLSTRMLAVAGWKQDDVERTRILGRVSRIGRDQGRATVVDGAIHTWDLQWPDLFASGITAWIEGRELPI